MSDYVYKLEAKSINVVLARRRTSYLDSIPIFNDFTKLDQGNVSNEIRFQHVFLRRRAKHVHQCRSLSQHECFQQCNYRLS